MKFLSLITLSALLSITSCSHFKKDCSEKKGETSCSKDSCKKTDGQNAETCTADCCMKKSN